MKIRYRVMFVSMALCIYATAMFPLFILIAEYQKDAWTLASSYSPLFLFPVSFLLFILPALYVPVRDYLSFTVDHWHDETRQKKRWWILFPIPLALIVTLVAVFLEVSQPTLAIWEVDTRSKSPSLDEVPYQNVNTAGIDRTPSLHLFYQLRAAKNQLDQLASLQSDDRLTLARVIEEGKRKYKEFLALDRLQSKSITPSKTRPFYIASFCAVLFVTALTLALIVFFSALHMAVGNDRAGFRGTCFSLTMATFCFLIWIPMRAATLEVKRSLYPNVPIFGEVLIGVMFVLAATAIGLSWFYEHKEKVMGAATIIGTLISALASYFAADNLLQIFEVPGFYFGFVTLTLFPVMGIFLYHRFQALANKPR